MKQLLIEESMPLLKSDLSNQAATIEATGQLPSKEELSKNGELRLWCVCYLVKESRHSEAALLVDSIVFDEDASQLPLLHHAWLWLARISLFIATSDYMLALGSAENCLNVLSHVTNKRDEDFLAIVASLLYNLAYIHHQLGDNGRAVKELTKSQKLFERLVKRNSSRFSHMLVYAVEASTTIFKSRIKQMNVLAHYQTTTELYTAMLNDDDSEKVREALVNLVDSLAHEGELMLSMGNGRHAVKFYTKALRYQKKVSNGMGTKELELSIGLAKALMKLMNRRAAAEQLLNSLLPLAQRLGDNERYTEIEQLLNNRNKNSNIMLLLKGLF